MLRLDKVSKFYSANGVVAAGFSKVSLDFKVGEFVAITGESGSGKSTLLNVISGLDSYEEGEMYILDEPTSGYGNDEMEEYRKKYIGNIFQTFNLINNYTVYQNIELSLLLAGYKAKEVKHKVNEIIEKVGLTEYRRTKTSKLSGGQKQRVAIARALAKETPIIVADEPTGNLDVDSAKGIIKLLAELSKEKLIIIVTHNYEQVEEYVTRKISMKDGKVAEDKVINFTDEMIVVSGVEAKQGKEHSQREPQLNSRVKVKEARHEGLSASNTLRLGVRNAFSIPVKFLLLLLVFLFICAGTFMAYSSAKNMEVNDQNFFNTTFSNTDARRIVVTRQDRGEFTQADYDKLTKMNNIDALFKDDIMLDTRIEIVDKSPYENKGDEMIQINFWRTVNLSPLEGLKESDIVGGRMIEAENEVVIRIDITDENVREFIEQYLDTEMIIFIDNYASTSLEKKIKIVGYADLTEEDKNAMNSNTGRTYDESICCSPDVEDFLRASINSMYSDQSVRVNDVIIPIGQNSDVPIIASDELERGEVYIPSSWAEHFEYSNWWYKTVDITTKGLYSEITNTYDIAYTYSQDNSEWLLGLKYDEMEKGIYMNPDDIKDMYDSKIYQVSVMMEHIALKDETVKNLENAGYKALHIQSSENQIDVIYNTIMRIFRMGLLSLFVLVIFFVSYFIIKLIFKSQNIYFSTVRMLGGSRKGCSGLMLVDMLVVFNIAYAISTVFLLKLKDDTISGFGMIKDLLLFVEQSDFAILYAIVLAITVLLSIRYSMQMFKKTAMNAYKEEV